MMELATPSQIERRFYKVTLTLIVCGRDQLIGICSPTEQHLTVVSIINLVNVDVVLLEQTIL